MIRFVPVLSAVLLLAVFSAPLARAQQASPSGQSLQQKVAQGNNAVAVQLYQVLGAREDNHFYSPYRALSAEIQAGDSL